MSETPWTAGPWVFQPMPPRDIRLKREHWAVGQAQPPQKGVAYVFGATNANARLLAAAPDLYNALATLLRLGSRPWIAGAMVTWPEWDAATEAAEQALSKARGEQ